MTQELSREQVIQFLIGVAKKHLSPEEQMAFGGALHKNPHGVTDLLNMHLRSGFTEESAAELLRSLPHLLRIRGVS